jgi:uncharacterized protein (TIGR03083 family)
MSFRSGRIVSIESATEGCQSGRMGRPRKPLWPPGHRGFESHTFRQFLFVMGCGLIAVESDSAARWALERIPVELNDWLGAIETEGRLFGELAKGRLDQVVPSCPEWNLADLVGHLGAVHRRITGVLLSGTVPDHSAGLPEPAERYGWYQEGLEGLLSAFAETDPEQPAWNWSAAEQVASFWWRRMAHETALHCWDARGVAGDPAAMDAVLASDGIDEWFDVFLRAGVGDRASTHTETDQAAVAGTIHVHCGDVDGEWWAQFDGSQLQLERTHRKGDVVMRADAFSLLLVLWGRRPVTSVEVLGDGVLLAPWLSGTRS